MWILTIVIFGYGHAGIGVTTVEYKSENACVIAMQKHHSMLANNTVGRFNLTCTSKD